VRSGPPGGAPCTPAPPTRRMLANAGQRPGDRGPPESWPRQRCRSAARPGSRWVSVLPWQGLFSLRACSAALAASALTAQTEAGRLRCVHWLQRTRVPCGAGVGCREAPSSRLHGRRRAEPRRLAVVRRALAGRALRVRLAVRPRAAQRLDPARHKPRPLAARFHMVATFSLAQRLDPARHKPRPFAARFPMVAPPSVWPSASDPARRTPRSLAARFNLLTAPSACAWCQRSQAATCPHMHAQISVHSRASVKRTSLRRKPPTATLRSPPSHGCGVLQLPSRAACRRRRAAHLRLCGLVRVCSASASPDTK